MNNQENKKTLSKYALTLLSLVVLFLISFSTSAWIYIKSNDLVFTDTIEDYEEKYQRITETEERITELEEQLARYKSMYEGAVRDNKLLSSTASAEVNKDSGDKASEEESDSQEITENEENKILNKNETEKLPEDNEKASVDEE